MNFKDYLESDGLKRSYNVIVTPEDCEYFYSVKYDSRFEFEMGLNVHGTVYHYVTKKGFGNTLYALDTDGNPKGRSCFVLLTSEEKSQAEAYLKKQDANNVMQQLADKNLNEVQFPVFTTDIGRKRI